jgi:hypothetical protein
LWTSRGHSIRTVRRPLISKRSWFDCLRWPACLLWS